MEAAAVPAGSTADPELDRASEREFSIAARAYGVALAVRASDAELLARLIARLPPGSDVGGAAPSDLRYAVTCAPRRSVPGGREEAVYTIAAADGRILESADEGEALELFESMVRFDVAVNATDWLFAHAGVVGWRGRAIVIPAPSMHGKSSLVQALVAAGADYYSDEFAVIDRDGRVWPFPIAASIRQPAGRAQRVPLAPSVDLQPLRIGVVVATRYEPGVEWRARRGTSGGAAMALLANTVRARLAPASVLKILARAAEGAVLLEGPRGEAADTAFRMLEGDHDA